MTITNRAAARSRHYGVQVAVAAALTAFAITACTPVADTETVPAEPAVSVIEAIQDLGQVGLPMWPEILDAESDSGADTRYRLVMRLDAEQLEEFLSQFPVGPAPSSIPRSMAVIAGPALDSAPNPLYLQTAIGSSDGTYIREIVVDERAPDAVYVHVSVFTV